MISPSEGWAEIKLVPVGKKAMDITTFGARFPYRFILLHTSLLVASIPRDQPVTRRSNVGFFGIASDTNVRWDRFGSSWDALIAASNEVVVATEPGGELQESVSIQRPYHS